MAPIATTNSEQMDKKAAAAANGVAEDDTWAFSMHGEGGFVTIGSSSGGGGGSGSNSSSPCPLSAPLIVTFVGLPCSGKSLAAHRVARHLCWRGELATVFTLESAATEENLAEVQAFFGQGNNIAIFDGMHLSRESRIQISRFCEKNMYHHLIIEMMCEVAEREENLLDTVSFHQKCDRNTDWEKLFRTKLAENAPAYEQCSAVEAPLIIVNSSPNPVLHAVTARGVSGAIQSCILGVLAHPLIKQQEFYFTRHGESEFNILGRIGGNADLSPRGMKYAERLTKYLSGLGTSASPKKPRLIWTSELQRTISTARHIPANRTCLKELNEIDAGICEGLTYEEIQERFPQEFVWRDQDKLKYRYPHGESYLDLLQRVDSVIQGLFTMSEVLLVSHQAVLRCIMAFFHGTKPGDIPYINVPLHTLLIVRSCGYDFEVETVPLKVECVDTYRVQPQNCQANRTDADALQTVPAHFDSPIL